MHRCERGILGLRTVLVVVPLLAGLALAGTVGVRMMTTERPELTVTCWDGVRAETVSACSTPTGLAGLRHVFPSLDTVGLDCEDDLAGADDDGEGVNLRPASWTCTVELGARTARITYFQLADPVQGVRYQQRRFGERPEGVTDENGTVLRRVWRGAVDDAFRLVAVYPDAGEAPYGVEVAAEGPQLRDRAFRTVRFRDVDRLRVAPA